MEKYVTPKIGGTKYGIENDDFVSIRAFMRNGNVEDWIELRITSRLKIVIERWNDGRDGEEPDREYIVDDKEDEKNVQKLIAEGIAVLKKVKQVQTDEEQAKLVGVDLLDLDYDVMKIVGRVFADFSNQVVPEAVEEALKL